jgi:hypothetical protein
MYWKIIENHPDLIFRDKFTEEIIGFSNPLFEDEATIQLLNHGRENFQFNGGYYKVHFIKFTASIKDVYLDPNFFILIKSRNLLIKETIVFDWYRTSFKKYILNILFRQYKKIDEAVLFDAKVGLNVFHFYNDILPKIFFGKANYSNLTFLIGEELYNSKLFKYYLQFDFVKNNNWKIVAKNEHIHVKNMHLIKTSEYDVNKLKLIADEVLSKLNNTKSQNLKLFINRKKSTGRTIANFKELEPILIKHNYIILYLEDITIREQIEYFSRATTIIGIHGAGLTNMIFSYRNNPKILEITASDFIPTHYYWLANSFEFSYKLYLGGKLQLVNSKNNFEVDILRLGNIISTF